MAVPHADADAASAAATVFTMSMARVIGPTPPGTGLMAEAIGSTLASGVRTMADVAASDPQLQAAFGSASTCTQMRKKEQSA